MVIEAMRKLLQRISAHIHEPATTRQLQDYRDRMEEEIEQARHMQQLLLPTKSRLTALKESHGLCVSSFFHPTSTIAGDAWDVFALDEHCAAFYISDFTGHGVGAAINSFRMHMLFSHCKENYRDAGALLTQLNQKLKKILSTETFSTFFYGVIDTSCEQLHYATAGSPAPYIYRCETQQCEAIDSSGIPLGIVRDYRYHTQSTAFHRGNSLCLYSDALVEPSEETHKEPLPEPELKSLLSSHMHQANTQGQRAFMRELIQKIGIMDGASFDDDLTLALITRRS